MGTKLLTLFCMFSSIVWAGPRFESGPSQVKLVELFSSEGCSSCPPADGWLASLRGHPGLWKSFVPVEFHVDYWNRLGWTDRFSKGQFTARQQKYASEWANGAVYTPGFVLSGKEWRPSGNAGELAAMGHFKPGQLTVSQTAPERFYVKFAPAARHSSASYKVYGALLANGLSSEVKSGENAGQKLRHEFVVVTLQEATLEREGEGFTSVLALKAPATVGKSQATSFSVAFWVTEASSQAPIQAAGGDL